MVQSNSTKQDQPLQNHQNHFETIENLRHLVPNIIKYSITLFPWTF